MELFTPLRVEEVVLFLLSICIMPLASLSPARNSQTEFSVGRNHESIQVP
jgi:hypothetical protein